MASYELKIVTPQGCAFEGEAERLSCRSVGGELAIMARHCDFCTALGMGTAHLNLPDGTVRWAACMGGMLTMLGGKASLVATTWEWAEDIDRSRAEAAKASAEAALAAPELDPKERELATGRLRRALVRLSAAEQVR